MKNEKAHKSLILTAALKHSLNKEPIFGDVGVCMHMCRNIYTFVRVFFLYFCKEKNN